VNDDGHLRGQVEIQGGAHIVNKSEAQVPPITGYRVLSPIEIALINDIKAKGLELASFFATLEVDPAIDKRWLAIAKTDLQKGFMALTRAVARPEGF
jgi:hypothetical protein